MRWFEQILWNSRFLVMIPVVACILISAFLFVLVTIEAIELPGHLFAFVDQSLEAHVRAKLYSDGITSIAKIIDGYLFAAIMLIFAMGLYELFISKLDVAEGNDIANRILMIRTFDDLKDKLAKVVFLILIVTYFESALGSDHDQPLQLLMLAAGIALVSGAIWLSNRGEKHAGK